MSWRLHLFEKVDTHSTGQIDNSIDINKQMEECCCETEIEQGPAGVAYLRACTLALVALIGVGCGAPSASAPSTSGQPVALTYAFLNDATSSAAATALIKAYNGGESWRDDRATAAARAGLRPAAAHTDR